MVCQTRRSSRLQLHQDLNRSYKEVCAPVIERCHFLFNELRPAIGNEIQALSRSRLLRSTPRWKDAIARVIHQNRKQKRKFRCNAARKSPTCHSDGSNKPNVDQLNNVQIQCFVPYFPRDDRLWPDLSFLCHVCGVIDRSLSDRTNEKSASDCENDKEACVN